MLSNKVAVGLVALVALGGAAGTGTYLASRQPIPAAKPAAVTRPQPLRRRTERSRLPRR